MSGNPFRKVAPPQAPISTTVAPTDLKPATGGSELERSNSGHFTEQTQHENHLRRAKEFASKHHHHSVQTAQRLFRYGLQRPNIRLAHLRRRCPQATSASSRLSLRLTIGLSKSWSLIKAHSIIRGGTVQAMQPGCIPMAGPSTRLQRPWRRWRASTTTRRSRSTVLEVQ
jgi:hypothetical protein